MAIGHLTYPVFDPAFLAPLIGVESAQIVHGSQHWVPPLYKYMISNYFISCFLLLSGFVIELYLQRTSPGTFLIQRVFRLLPVLWVATAVALILRQMAGLPLPSLDVIVQEALLWKGYSLNPVAWTLLIQVQFYVTAALFVFYGIGLLARTVILSGGFLSLSLLHLMGIDVVDSEWHSSAVGILFWLSWIHMGTLTFYLWKRNGDFDRVLRVAGIHALLFGLGYLATIDSVLVSEHFKTLAHPLSASLLTIFVALFVNDSLPRIRPLESLASITYSLYLLHIPVGWLAFYLTFQTIGVTAAVALGFMAVLLASYLVSAYIEMPLNAYGKALTRKRGAAVAWAERGWSLVKQVRGW